MEIVSKNKFGQLIWWSCQISAPAELEAACFQTTSVGTGAWLHVGGDRRFSVRRRLSVHRSPKDYTDHSSQVFSPQHQRKALWDYDCLTTAETEEHTSRQSVHREDSWQTGLKKKQPLLIPGLQWTCFPDSNLCSLEFIFRVPSRVPGANWILVFVFYCHGNKFPPS